LTPPNDSIKYGKMSDDLLTSWKEIADFLHVDIRTCQRWEKQLDMPVYRYDGLSKSRVSVKKSELRLWQEKQLAGVAREEAPPIRRRAALWPILLLLSSGALLYAVLRPVLFPPQSPPFALADYHIRGSTLIGVDKKDVTIFEFDTRFDKLASEKFYREEPAKNEAVPKKVFPFVLVRDLDGDGSPEMVFSIQSTDEYGEGKLYCFGPDNTPKWQFDAGGTYEFGSKSYSDFRIDGLAAVDLDGDGLLEIIVNVAHMDDFPSRLLVLSAQGKVIGDFWNSGRITDLAFGDLDNDGRLEILAVGTNNEYERAFLAVFDPRTVRGYSPQSRERYLCKTAVPGTEEYYVLFPRTDVDRFLSPLREVMESITITNNQTLRLVLQFSRLAIYLDFQCRPAEISNGSEFRHLHDQLVQEGRIASVLNAEYVDAYKKGITYWTGKGWTSVPSRVGP
jgi:hypothetical protein